MAGFPFAVVLRLTLLKFFLARSQQISTLSTEKDREAYNQSITNIIAKGSSKRYVDTGTRLNCLAS